MWPNPQKTADADFVTFGEDTLMENFIFCTVNEPFETRNFFKKQDSS